MDGLDSPIKAGHEIASFPGVEGLAPVSYSLQDKAELSCRTQDTQPKFDQSLARVLVMDALGGKLQDSQPSDPLVNLRSLEEACGRGWLLSTTPLSGLLGLKSLQRIVFNPDFFIPDIRDTMEVPERSAIERL